MEATVSHSHIGSVDVAVGDGRVADAAFEAVNVVEQAEVLNDHGCA